MRILELALRTAVTVVLALTAVPDEAAGRQGRTPAGGGHQQKESKADSTAAVLEKAGGSTADSIPMYWMKEIVVTGRRVSSRVEDLAMSVSVISDREIGTTTRNSSTDLAGVLPGVFIDRTGDFGRSDVSIRGLGSRGRYSLVLIDGRPEKMALFDCTVTHSFPLNDVDRIEVIKGASSMLYGSGAMGGVMNVIPRGVKETLEIDLKAYGGSNDTWVANGRLAGKKGKVAGHVSVDYRESAGHVEHSAYDGKDITAGGRVEISPRYSLLVSGKYFDGHKEEPLRSTDDPSIVSDTWNDYTRGSADLHLKGTGEAYSVNLRYYRSLGEHRFSDGFHSSDATDGLMAYGALDMREDLEVSWGADYRYQQGKLPDEPGAEWNKWEYGAYAAAEYTFREVVILSGGLRYNRDEIAGDQTSPSFGVVCRPSAGTSVRALASHGFRSPQINELYMYPSSNQDLKAERVWNFELGLRQKLTGSLEIDISAFRTDGRDMIELVPNGSPPPMFIFANSGEFRFLGIESSLTGKWDCGLAARVSHSWLDAGDWTVGRPGSKLDLILTMNRGRHMVELKGQRVDLYYAGNESTLRIDPFTVIDIYAESGIGGGAKAFAGINNILDEKYDIYADLAGGAAGLFRMPGISIMAGLKYSL